MSDRADIMPAVYPKLGEDLFCTVAAWLKKLNSKNLRLNMWLRRIYGEYEDLHKEKIDSFIKVLNCYGNEFGFNEKVCIVRAPGRINLMGRHVDHRGGCNNLIALDRETMAVVGLRKDNHIIAVNAEPEKFGKVEFRITELLDRHNGTWIDFVNSDIVRDMLRKTAGNWGNYLRAAVLRLQHKFPDKQIFGLNIAVYGNVPPAAGLSSSSTLVVSTLEAACRLNNISLSSREFVDLCGEGEWFVGSRGGSGDHAAIYLGRRAKIVHVSYFPFEILKTVNFPKGYHLIVANSQIKAAKSHAAKDTFNEKVTSYNLGLALLKQKHPQLNDKVERLRDIDPDKLGISTQQIYKMLLDIPEFMTRDDFKSVLSKEHKDFIETNFATHCPPKRYNVRGVLLYGIAEIMRSKLCADYFDAGKIEEFGTLMNISHDGDRVCKRSNNGSYISFESDCSDAFINRLINDIDSGDKQKIAAAQLQMQSGGYACSIEPIDRMVDIALSVPGVVGAQIAGAGLGGCVMIFAQSQSVVPLTHALLKNYYEPANLMSGIIPCLTVEGAGLAEF